MSNPTTTETVNTIIATLNGLGIEAEYINASPKRIEFGNGSASVQLWVRDYDDVTYLELESLCVKAHDILSTDDILGDSNLLERLKTLYAGFKPNPIRLPNPSAPLDAVDHLLTLLDNQITMEQGEDASAEVSAYQAGRVDGCDGARATVDWFFQTLGSGGLGTPEEYQIWVNSVNAAILNNARIKNNDITDKNTSAILSAKHMSANDITD